MSSEDKSKISDEERASLNKEADAIREGIKGIKDTLNKLNAEKEKHFDSRRKIREQLTQFRDKSDEFKRKRDTLTKEVRELKKKRDEINKILKKKTDDMKTSQDQFDSAKDKLKFKENPIALRRQIDKLEEKIETEAISFEAEKKLMKQINEMRAKLKATAGLSAVMSDIKGITHDVQELKHEGKSQHLIVQKKAADSQAYHEELILLYKKMDELRPKEKEANDAFLKLKADFNKHNDELKAEIGKLKDIQHKLGEAFEEEEKERKKKETKKLKDMEMEVEEKIKKGKKLTVDDLLVFQKTESDKLKHK